MSGLEKKTKKGNFKVEEDPSPDELSAKVFSTSLDHEKINDRIFYW